ncbi:MAG: CdaR family protein [Syntrophomonas sp.]|nr:CdaR family protein [Syntrophomonas sp.]
MFAMNPKRKKIWLRIASVTMAILLWFYVVNQGDVSTGSNLLEVELKYRNQPAHLTVIGPDKVSVKLWGSFRGVGDIIAYADLSDLNEGEHQVPVKMEPVKGAMVTSVQPDKVTITLQELSEKVFNIKHEIKQSPPAGYQLTEILLASNNCVVKGEADAVGRVAAVVAPIELGNLKDITAVKVQLQARDVNGRTIVEGVKIIPSAVDAYIALERKQISKQIPIKPDFSGEVAKGYSLGEVKCHPDQVTVIGEETQLEAVNEIVTKPIDINGKSEDFIQMTELVHPQEILVFPAQTTIEVKIIKNSANEVQ